MRIREIVLDAIIGTRLFEMAFQRKRAIDVVQSLSYEINLHLLKILMYGRVRDYDKWCHEINTWLLRIQRTRLKGDNFPLNFEILYELLWEGYLESPDEVRDLISDIDREYSASYKLVDYDYFEIHKKIQDILYNVCKDISIEKFEDIRNYL
jgi:hypothetical protein